MNTASDAPLTVQELAAPAGARLDTRGDVSVAGVLLLSAVAVFVAVLAVVAMGACMVGAWWLLSHIPVPQALKHLARLLHLA